MALEAQVTQEQLDQMPEPIKAEYEAVPDRDGVYQLSVNPGDSGLQLTNAASLKSTLEKERQTARDAQKKLKNFEGLDPEAAREALDFKTKFDAGELDNEAEARLKAREKELHEKYEQQRKQLEGKVDETSKFAQEREQQLLRELRSAKVSEAVKSAIRQNGGSEHLLAPIVERKVDLAEEDGKFSVQVLNDDGQPMLSRKPGAGAGDPMTIDEFVASLRERDEYAPAFAGSGSTGGGSGGKSTGSGMSVGGKIRISSQDAKDVAKFRAARKQAAESGKELEITD